MSPFLLVPVLLSGKIMYVPNSRGNFNQLLFIFLTRLEFNTRNSLSEFEETSSHTQRNIRSLGNCKIVISSVKKISGDICHESFNWPYQC